MGPGGRQEVPTETACGGRAKHSIPPGIAKAESVVSAEADAAPGKATGAGHPTTKKMRRLKAGEGNRALQRAIATQRAVEIRHREEAGRNRRGVEQQQTVKSTEKEDPKTHRNGQLRHQAVRGQTGAQRRLRVPQTITKDIVRKKLKEPQEGFRK